MESKPAIGSGQLKPSLLGVLFCLFLYCANIALQLENTIQFFSVYDCRRSFRHEIQFFQLQDFFQAAQQQTNLTSGENFTSEAQSETDLEPDLISDVIERELRVTIANITSGIVPQHWKERITDVLKFHFHSYRPSQAHEYCSLNSKRFNSTFELGSYLCHRGLSDQNLKDVSASLGRMNVSYADDVLLAMVKNDFAELQNILPASLGIKLTKSGYESVQNLLEVLSHNEINQLMALLDDPEVTASLGLMIEAFGKLEKRYIDEMGAAIAKIDPNNIPIIEEKLGRLNLTFSDFITNPTIFVK